MTSESNGLTYKTYQGMKQRCYNPNCSQYKNYGARGITVCDRWLESYKNFLEDMGVKPAGFSLDRIDNNKGYSKENCRWATAKQQRDNQRNVRMMDLDGESLCLRDWAKRAGMSEMTLKGRLDRGMSLREAIETPLDQRQRKKIYQGLAKRWGHAMSASQGKEPQ